MRRHPLAVAFSIFNPASRAFHFSSTFKEPAELPTHGAPPSPDRVSYDYVEAARMNKSPVFPVTPEANHYSDYGFDPQIDCFQVLEEARRHAKRVDQRPLDSLRCKLQKPISKDDGRSKKRRRGWWRSVLIFWRRPKVGWEAEGPRRSSSAYRSAVSGPIYSTESLGGVSGRRTSRACSGPLTAAEVGAEAAGTAYLSLRDLGVGRVSPYAAAPPAVPIYLVT